MDDLQSRNGQSAYRQRGADRRRERQDSRESIEVTTPAGGFKFKGEQMFPVLLLLLFFAFTAYMLWVHDSSASERIKAVSVKIDQTQALMEKQEATHKVMLYVLYVCHAFPEDCKALNLVKPPEIRDMQR